MRELTISKLEAARRQLDTAITLYFDNGDSLSVHSLASASFRLLFDLYPSMRNDGYSARIDELIQRIGWKRFSSTANFLKHADQDPDALLGHHTMEAAEGVIGLASCLYRRLNGDFSTQMRAFDCWTEALHPEAFDIPPDLNPEVAAAEANAIQAIRNAPLGERLAMGKVMGEALTKLWSEHEDNKTSEEG